MPKAKRDKNCHVCEQHDGIRMTYMTCGRCARHYCSQHGDPKLDECSPCLEDGEEM